MRKTIAAGVVAGFALAAGFIAPAQAISATTADLSVLHGIPDTPVDVYVNGELTLDDFQPGDLAGPLDLPAGDYEVALTATDAADASAPILGPITLSLAANTSYTAVAFLDEAGDPTAKLFTNDTQTTAAGEGRLTVRHVAAAPAVDILAGGAPVVEDLVNPNEATLNLPAGTVSASVALAGTTEPVLGPADVAIQDGVLTIVYAWGSAEAGNLALAVQNVTVGHTAPGGVNSGTAGYAAERDTAMQAGWIVGIAFAAAAASVTVVLARRSRAAKTDA
ncbi:DUF4397 domain-containing protein [Microbacterium sp. zg.B48]|uniref:DUF4397 domain-containing protein n=1 Tax=unclassified Microbacterium TaxID=2609290 RepID=UPI00214C33EE|nr:MULTISPECIES: DUF4397 domain-containing protein [unclassified Microbacterium]MCR2763566.1 DUF4397 domain-containing protein [Microbacterium sp. zg.B48]MCR2809288.1 DUF4397 domain-containing protein [Microbacterium sp. zg.B185]WIM20431.1 DUF4397 domain-containing protein [Microbacterium sp. zg-B185]